jgi:spore coat protein U-like protein
LKFSNAFKSALPAIALGFLGFGLVPMSAIAATATTTFAVTATVQATCLVSATAMAFGTYTGVTATSSSTVSVTCTNTTPYNLGLSAGLATGATVSTRSMTGPGAALLGYALFSDSGRTVNWGQTIGTDTVTGTGNGSAQALTVYGQVAAAQYLAPGAYTDTITATITY